MKGIYWRTLTYKQKCDLPKSKLGTHRIITGCVIVHGRAYRNVILCI